MDHTDLDTVDAKNRVGGARLAGALRRITDRVEAISAAFAIDAVALLSGTAERSLRRAGTALRSVGCGPTLSGAS